MDSNITVTVVPNQRTGIAQVLVQNAHGQLDYEAGPDGLELTFIPNEALDVVEVRLGIIDDPESDGGERAHFESGPDTGH